MKIKYGIDLGTTNSAIARIDSGDARIQKIDGQHDTLPSCVAFDKKGAFRFGESALNMLDSDRKRAMRTWVAEESNTFIEFKRAMGTDRVYESKNAGSKFTPEDLSAEVLKVLKSFAPDEQIASIVVTVPAKFTINQNDATRRAAAIAGFKQIELLQEPVAASMAYGLSNSDASGLWLVFDFGGGTFDVALVSVEDGIIKVEDTEGNNHLGGTNLDYAIVDNILLPYFEANYSIASILSDDKRKQIFRDAMKIYADEAKVQLSFNDSHNLLSDLGEIPGEDDNGEEFELDLEVDQAAMRTAIGPIFQQAIDISKNLLERRNLKGSDLSTVLLVGGPTYSPILRTMLREQLTENIDTSVDPMTVVACGAALYASSIDVTEEVRDETRDRRKLQLQLSYEATTVEMNELVTVRVRPDKTDEAIPEGLFVEFVRGDGAWSSGRVPVDGLGELVELGLRESQANQFEVLLFDSEGNRVEAEPAELTILQGSQVGSATMPYHFGIEVFNRRRGELLFEPVKGLEKNQSLPTKGIVRGLKTSMDVRPGNPSDVITIPLYQGEHDAEGTRALYNEHVYVAQLTGADFAALVPEDTEIEFTVEISRDQEVSLSVFIPALDVTKEIAVPRDTTQTCVDAEQLDREIEKGANAIDLLRSEGFVDDQGAVEELEKDLEEIKVELGEGRSQADRRMQVLGNLRSVLKGVDRLSEESEWPRTESELKDFLYRLEQANSSAQEPLDASRVEELRNRVEDAVAQRDRDAAVQLIDVLRQAYSEVVSNEVGYWLGLLESFRTQSDVMQWSDRRRAEELLRQGVRLANENPSVAALRPIVFELFDLLPNEERIRAEAQGIVSR